MLLVSGRKDLVLFWLSEVKARTTCAHAMTYSFDERTIKQATIRLLYLRPTPTFVLIPHTTRPPMGMSSQERLSFLWAQSSTSA